MTTITLAGKIIKIIDSPAYVQIMSNIGNYFFVLEQADLTRLNLTIGSLSLDQNVTLTITKPPRMYGSVTAITLGT